MANIPHSRVDVLDGANRFTRDWYDYFRRFDPSAPASGGSALSTVASSESALWGGISGNLSDQTDLQAAIDAKGFKNLPKITSGLEVGKCFSTSTGFTVNTGTEGDICSVYNNSGSSVTLTRGGSVTLRVAGTATTGNYSLPQRGFVTLRWHTASEVIIL